MILGISRKKRSKNRFVSLLVLGVLLGASSLQIIGLPNAMAVGPATKIVLTTQAGGGATGLAFTTQPQLTLQDASSNTVTGSTPVITATVTTGGNQKEKYLVGTTTATVASGTGIATFLDLGLNAVLNQNYTI